MLTEEQKALLDRPLERERIKQRQQSGTNLSYIEGWDAIQKANEIFGYDGWSNDVLQLDLVGTEEYSSSQGKKGWQVVYKAIVRVNALGTYHTDVGYGNGIDYKSALAAHEMAQKEAVTDALKRALKDFGDQFGLTLYDKLQRGVEEKSPQPKAPAASAPAPTGKREPPATPADLEPASDDEINAFYAYAVEHGADSVKMGESLQKAREKYNGIIPKPWIEHQFTQARLKYGDALNV